MAPCAILATVANAAAGIPLSFLSMFLTSRSTSDAVVGSTADERRVE
jgi:hypothetical protein